MNIEQLRALAKSKSLPQAHRFSIKVSVGSLSEGPIAADLRYVIQNAIDDRKLDASVVRAGSFGCYDLEPIVAIGEPEFCTVLYNNVTPDAARELINDFFGKKVFRKAGALCCVGNNRMEGIPHISELPLFNMQRRTALRNCGWIDPEDIDDYILRGRGFTRLSQALQMNRQELLDVHIVSALTGRLAAGDSSADRWRLVQDSEEEDRCLICKAIDADPKARTAPLLLESDPYSILEGILIGAYAIGATRCLVLIEENENSARRLRSALEQMKVRNLLGEHVLESQFNAEIEIKEVPASCMSGYETELFRCIEEKQPLPHVYPTYPAVEQLTPKPAVIASPEAMSGLSALPPFDVKEGTGSMIVTLAGQAIHKYTVEVAAGTPVREIVGILGGGASNGKMIKAIRVGGPSGRFIAWDSCDLCIGGDDSAVLTSNLNASSIEVFDTSSNIVEAVRDIMSFVQAQSCGRCVFCREGTHQMFVLLEDFCENKGTTQDLELLAELGRDMKSACLCVFGRAAPDAVLSSIELFRSEYEERIQRSPFSLRNIGSRI
jgi:NADH:ubiquinone oxidoreductase subunit F (NADH-binding)